MTYENILFHKSNMATRDGYFYLIDYPRGMLSQKTANGKNTFQFPLDIPNSFTDYTVDDVSCLQYDGYSFWSMQNFTADNGFLLRRWIIDNNICVLHDQFPYIDTATDIYRSETFSVEYYNTTLSSDALDGTYILNLSEFTDFVVYTDTVIGVGYNKFDQRELVTVSGVEGDNIYLYEPLVHSYYTGDPVTIVPSVLLFNDYTGTDDSVGSLTVLNSNTGVMLTYDSDVEYSGISASKFTRLYNILQEHPDVYTLAYVKNTNLKLRDMGDIYRYRARIKASDTFDGPDNSAPDEELWEVLGGNPKILNNQLFCSTAGAGHDNIRSLYTTVADFDVSVSGTLGSNFIFDDGAFAHHYLSVENFRTSDLCYIARSINTLSSNPYTVYGMDLLVSGTLNDASGNNNHAVLTGTSVSGSVDYGDAVWFDGLLDSGALTDYTINNQIKQVYFREDFETSHSNWRYLTGAAREAIAEHSNSGTYAARMFGGANIISRTISGLTTLSGLRLNFWAMTGDNVIISGPENITDELHIEYFASDSTWKEIDVMPGNVPYGTKFNQSYDLPLDAYHEDLRLQFYNTANDGGGDTWLVDDVMIVGPDYDDDSTEISLSFWLKPDSLSTVTNSKGLGNVFFSLSNPDPDIIFMDDFSTSSNWDWQSGADYISYTSRYGVYAASVNGNGQTVALKNPIDLSGYTENVKFYCWIQVGTDEWCSYCRPEDTDYVKVQYYNSSGTWVNLENIIGGIALKIEERNYTLPADAYHSGFKVRFQEYTNSGGGADYFTIADVMVYDATQGDITIQPRPALDLGITSDGNLKVSLNNSNTSGSLSVLEFGAGEIIPEEWNFINFTFVSGDITTVLNGSTYTTTLTNDKIISRAGMVTYIGHAAEKSSASFTGSIADIKIMDSKATSTDLRLMSTYIDKEEVITVRDSFDPKVANLAYATLSGISEPYYFRATRVGTDINYYYRWEEDVAWTHLYTHLVDLSSEHKVGLGLNTQLLTVSSSYFDDLIYESGYIRFPLYGSTYFGIMQMDNVQTNQSTVHKIYDIDIDGDDLYRLQKTATYYGSNYSWSTYNFQVSPIRSFIDFITLDSDTHILPATGRNVTPVRSITLDQYGQGVVNRPVTITDDDDVGFITTEVVYTDIFYNTGRADTAYTSGTDLRVVNINAKVTQLD